jgi:hypothetical protein
MWSDSKVRELIGKSATYILTQGLYNVVRQ